MVLTRNAVERGLATSCTATTRPFPGPGKSGQVYDLDRQEVIFWDGTRWVRAGGVPLGPIIKLDTTTVEAGTTTGTVVGNLTVVDGGAKDWTFSLTATAGNRFAVSAATLTVGATALNHLEAGPTVTVSASNGVDTITRDFSIKVRQPLPKTAASLTFASNRPSFPSVGATANAADASALGHTYHVAPEYGITGGMRLLFCNFWIAGDGTANPERKPGTTKTIDFATVFVGGSTYPVRFGGAESVVIPDGGFVWSDVVMLGAAELTMPARQAYYVRVSETTPVGKTRVAGLGSQFGLPRFANWSTAEGVEYTTAPQTGKKTAGTVAAYSNGSQPVGPNMIVAKGWDGSAVYAIFGDSIGASQSDGGTNTANRGVLGHIGRALDDIGSGRRSFANLCVPGTKPQDQAEDIVGQFALRLAAIRALPNQPFNKVISRMGQNGIFPLTASAFSHFGALQPANLQAAIKKWWAFLREAFGADIFQVTFTPRSQDNAFTYAYWTDPAAQKPTDPTVDGAPAGTRFQANDWLVSAGGLPSYVIPIDDRAAFFDATYQYAFKKVDGDWIVSTAAASGVGITTPVVFAGATAPIAGDWFVFEPGNANAETRQSYRVTGSGPWSVYFISNLSRPHAAGTAIRVGASGDGLHPGHSLHLAGAALLIAEKAAGRLP